jgi:hypothetical protein
MANSFDALVDAIGASWDFTMGDASGHLTERIGAVNTTVETSITYGVNGLPEVPYTAIGFTTSSLASAPSNAAFDIGDGPFSIMLVFSQTAAMIGVSRVPLIKGSTGGSGWQILINNSDTVVFRDVATSTAIMGSDGGPATISDTGRHVIIVTKTGATRVMYVDGVNVTALDTNVTLTNSTSVLQLGNNAGSPFAGTIYRQTGFKLVLTAAQALTLSSAALGQGWNAQSVPKAQRFTGRVARTRRFQQVFTWAPVTSGLILGWNQADDPTDQMDGLGLEYY